MKRFLSCYRSYGRLLAVVVIGSVLSAVLETLFPMVVRHILDVILPSGDLEALLRSALGLLGLYVLCLLLTFLVYDCGRNMGARIEHDLRCALFSHVEGLSFSFFDRVHTGRLVSTVISDISEIGDLVFQLPNLALVCTITMAGSAFFMFRLNWQLACLVLVVLALKTADTIWLNRRMKKTFFRAREKMGSLSAVCAESFSAIRVIQAFGSEKRLFRHFEGASRNLCQAQQRTNLLEAYLMSTILFFTNLNNLVIIAAGSYFIIHGAMAVADLVVFLMYLMLFIRPIMQLTVLTERYQRSMAGFRRYAELMDQRAEIVDRPGSVEAKGIEGRLEFRCVSFSYPGSDTMILKDFNLTVAPGETVAIVGATGVGKSSIANLILRFYDVSAGSIVLDGRDIRDYTLASLRQAVGIVQQDVFLFARSIRDNIALGDETAPDEALREAAKKADAAAFIEALPEGYDSYVGERGVLLSGGQKQRLAIARMFLKNPPVLILDEATSSLDNETELRIQQALTALSAKRTTLIIAHRLATIRQADRIVVLTGEGIAEEGSHEALMAKKGAYYDLYRAQFSSKA